jgi:hypothetical protein
MDCPRPKIKIDAGPTFYTGPPTYAEIFEASLLGLTHQNKHYAHRPGNRIYDGYLADDYRNESAAFSVMGKAPNLNLLAKGLAAAKSNALILFAISLAAFIASEAWIAVDDSQTHMNNEHSGVPRSSISGKM